MHQNETNEILNEVEYLLLINLLALLRNFSKNEKRINKLNTIENVMSKKNSSE